MSGLDPSTIEDIYELSPMQQGMLLDGLAVNNQGMYRVLLAYNIEGRLDEKLFQQAWQQAARRHAVIRTSIHYESLEKPLQVVHKDVQLPLEVVDIQHLSAQQQEDEVRQCMDDEKNRPFDITSPPLMSLKVFKTGADSCWLLWIIHHIMIEGWSAAIILQDVFKIYTALLRGTPAELEPLLSYRDFILWTQQQNKAEARQYWQKQLQGITAPTPLNVDKGSVRKLSAVVDYETEHMSPGVKTSKALEVFARKNKLTVNTLVRAAWSYLLHRYSTHDDVVFGTMVAGRSAPLSGIESMVGLAINLLPVRVSVPQDATIIEWLRSLQSQQMEMSQYEQFGLTQIKAWSDVDKNMPLFETLLIFENWAGDVVNWEGPLKVSDFKGGQVGQGYPITAVIEPGEDITIALLYDTKRFDAETIQRMLQYFICVLESIPELSQQPVQALPALTEADREILVSGYGGAATVTHYNELAHELFERQAAAHPERIAVVFGNQRLSYRELNERANRLAHGLQSMGIGPGDVAGICMHRSDSLIVAVLAALKAGAAYCPLDPNYPGDRLGLMLEDARPGVILTTGDLLSQLPDSAIPVRCLDDDSDWLGHYAVTNPESGPRPDDLAYIIFTSGSTGRPKGVQVTHNNLVNAYYGWEQVYRLAEQPMTHLQMANFSFDVFSGDMMRALGSGGTLVLAPHETLLVPENLYQLMQQEKVDCAEFVPAVLRALMNYLEKTGQSLDFMRLLLVGSDSWYVSEHERVRQLCGDQTRLIDSYGLTEATIDSTWFEDSLEHLPANGIVPIGRPFPGSRVYLLDSRFNPVPIGVPGELCIAGAGVASGYLNRDELNKEKFVPDPFGRNDERLYRTGDLARFLPDGNLQLLGRIDHQIKLRGFRIEMGEIESTMAELPGISQAVVTVREDRPGNRRLVAYIVAEPGMRPTPADLRQALRERLPEYMVPSVFQLLEGLPISPNGKVDRSRLPEPEQTAGYGDVYVAPATQAQKQIAAIWQQILSLEKIGIHDNFFDLGGHSLLLMSVRMRLMEQFQRDIPIVDLFEHSTIAELSNYLNKKQDRQDSDAVDRLREQKRQQGRQRLQDRRARMQAGQ